MRCIKSVEPSCSDWQNGVIIMYLTCCKDSKRKIIEHRIYIMVDNPHTGFKKLLLLLLMLLLKSVSWCWMTLQWSLVMILGSGLGMNACGRKLEEVEYTRELGAGGERGGIARWLVTALADPIGSSKAK